MNLDLSGLIRRGTLYAEKHAPAILTYLGIGGFFTTTALAVVKTPEAMHLIDEKKRREQRGQLTMGQVIKATWKCYIPAAVMAVGSTGCLIGANVINGRRQAALMAAYSLSERAVAQYHAKVVETLGKRKEQAIREAVDKERIDNDPPSKEILMAAGNGKTLCYDAFCGRYFYSDRAAIMSAVNELNRRMSTYTEPYVSLNQLYMEVGLPVVEVGDLMGWNVNTDLIKVFFTSQLVDGTTPALVMSFDTTPDYKYNTY